MDLITVIFVCGPKSEEYIGFAIETLLQTANHSERFKFIIGYNKPLEKPTYFKQLFEKNHITNHQTIDVINYLEEASSSHMKSLTEILYSLDQQNQNQNQNQTKKILICDADIAFLKKGWDTIMENLLTPTNIIVGSAYPNEAVKKYQNFPTLYVALIDFIKFRELKIDLMPDIDRPNHVRRVDINNEKLSRDFNLPLGKTIKYDSGYQIPVKIKSANLTGTPFENIEVVSHLPTIRNKKYGLFTTSPPKSIMSNNPNNPNNPNIFYEIYYQNQLLFTHLGNSRNKDFHTHPDPIFWRNLCQTYIQKHQSE